MSEAGQPKKILFVFLLVTLVSSLIIMAFSNWKVGLAFGALVGLFSSFHLGRNLSAERFEINATSKDKMKGLSWYENEIMGHMHDLNYELIVNQSSHKLWRPSPRGRIMGGEFEMTVTPYSITISGPRGLVRIIKSVLDIDKIFL